MILKFRLSLAIWICCSFAAIPLSAQYTLDEIGVAVAPGIAFLDYNEAIPRNFVGPAASVQGFYSHYFCGKSYGIQVQGGFRYAVPRSADAPSATRNFFSFFDFQAAGLFKLRPVDYHRRKEWAVLVGPVINVPLSYRYHTQFAGERRATPVNNFIPVALLAPAGHLSFQFRRPAGEESWFIQPGTEFGLLPFFQDGNGSVARRFEVFLAFGYTFMNKRG